MSLNKEKTYSPKEALDADPNWTKPVKLGRGRMPTGGDAHCKELAAKGYRIKGYQIASSTPAPAGVTPAAPVVNKVAANGVKEVKDFVIFWPEETYKAVGKDKKVWGMREACNTCRVSLVQCHCPNPTILDNIPVTITRK